MDTVIPANYITPNITFTGVKDPESHLNTYNAQMIISGGTYAIHCKMFMGMFIGTKLQWFVGFLDGYITSFEQFIVNQARPPVSFNLFGVKQR